MNGKQRLTSDEAEQKFRRLLACYLSGQRELVVQWATKEVVVVLILDDDSDHDDRPEDSTAWPAELDTGPKP